MAQLTDLSDIINRLTGGYSGSPQTIFFIKQSLINGTAFTNAATANRWQSLWLIDGAPSCGGIPVSAETCTNTTNGGLKQLNPNSDQQQWITNFSATISQNNGMIMLYDRLVHSGGYVANTTSVQTVNTPPLTRYSGTSSVGNQILVEIYSNIGTTARVLTITYTNQDGVSGKTTTTSIGSTTGNTQAAAWIPTLASGDTGVISIQSVQLNGSTTTAGNFGVGIIRPIIMSDSMLNLGSNNYFVTGVPSIPEIKSEACLAFLINLTNASTAADYVQGFNGHIQLINK